MGVHDGQYIIGLDSKPVIVLMAIRVQSSLEHTIYQAKLVGEYSRFLVQRVLCDLCDEAGGGTRKSPHRPLATGFKQKNISWIGVYTSYKALEAVFRKIIEVYAVYCHLPSDILRSGIQEWRITYYFATARI